MASLITVGINLSKIDKSKITTAKNGDKYLQVTISVNNDTNQYGQNVSAYINQSKEESDGKAPKSYLGNGKVVWTDGSIVRAEKQGENGNPAAAATGKNDDDLPF